MAVIRSEQHMALHAFYFARFEGPCFSAFVNFFEKFGFPFLQGLFGNVHHHDLGIVSVQHFGEMQRYIRADLTGADDADFADWSFRGTKKPFFILLGCDLRK